MKKRLPKLAISLSFGLLIFVSLLFVPANLALAADALKFNPQIPIPGMGSGPIDVGSESDGMMTSDLLSRYIKAIYDYGLKAAGVLAAVVLMGGGLIWLTSGGNQTKIGQAKEMIIGSVTGLIILFGAYMILNTVNPALLELKPISLPKLTNIGCCEVGQSASMITESACKSYNGEFYQRKDNVTISIVSNRCKEVKTYCNIRRTCEGEVDLCFDSDIGTKEIYKENCGGYFNNDIRDLYEIKDGECSFISECNNKKIDCNRVPNGDRCPEVEVSGILNDIEIDAYCYNNFCLRGKAQEAEECGTKPGAFCSPSDCNNLGTANQTYYRDNSGGRPCANNNLYCCYKG